MTWDFAQLKFGGVKKEEEEEEEEEKNLIMLYCHILFHKYFELLQFSFLFGASSIVYKFHNQTCTHQP